MAPTSTAGPLLARLYDTYPFHCTYSRRITNSNLPGSHLASSTRVQKALDGGRINSHYWYILFFISLFVKRTGFGVRHIFLCTRCSQTFCRRSRLLQWFTRSVFPLSVVAGSMQELAPCWVHGVYHTGWINFREQISTFPTTSGPRHPFH